MGGAVRSLSKGVGGVVGKIFGQMGGGDSTPTTITNNIGTSGLGTLSTKEALASPEEKKLSTLNKKKLGSKGAVIPLQSTATNPATSGVQI